MSTDAVALAAVQAMTVLLNQIVFVFTAHTTKHKMISEHRMINALNNLVVLILFLQVILLTSSYPCGTLGDMFFSSGQSPQLFLCPTHTVWICNPSSTNAFYQVFCDTPLALLPCSGTQFMAACGTLGDKSSTVSLSRSHCMDLWYNTFYQVFCDTPLALLLCSGTQFMALPGLSSQAAYHMSSKLRSQFSQLPTVTASQSILDT